MQKAGPQTSSAAQARARTIVAVGSAKGMIAAVRSSGNRTKNSERMTGKHWNVNESRRSREGLEIE